MRAGDHRCDHRGRDPHPYTLLGARLGLAPLPASYFGWLLLILLSYAALTQGMKVWYIRRFKMWL